MKPDCPGCAALWAAQELFHSVEAFGRKHGMNPDAMQAALTELLALWVGVNTAYQLQQGDIRAPVDSVLLATVRRYDSAVRHAAHNLPVSDDFKADSDALHGHRH